jgi:hypothetical protein
MKLGIMAGYSGARFQAKRFGSKMKLDPTSLTPLTERELILTYEPVDGRKK